MRLHSSKADPPALFAVASRLLQYPDEELLGCLPAIEGIAGRLPADSCKPLLAFVGYLRSRPLVELQAAYVETFDLRQRNCLYLTFSRTGDTRGRGIALWRFAELYRLRGRSLAGKELPDFLPALLELAAEAEPGDREPFELLVRYRPEIALLRLSLSTDVSPYADVVAALECGLPRPDPNLQDEVRRLAEEGPPGERVGIAPDIRWLGADEVLGDVMTGDEASADEASADEASADEALAGETVIACPGPWETGATDWTQGAETLEVRR